MKKFKGLTPLILVGGAAAVLLLLKREEESRTAVVITIYDQYGNPVKSSGTRGIGAFGPPAGSTLAVPEVFAEGASGWFAGFKVINKSVYSGTATLVPAQLEVEVLVGSPTATYLPLTKFPTSFGAGETKIWDKLSTPKAPQFNIPYGEAGKTVTMYVFVNGPDGVQITWNTLDLVVVGATIEYRASVLF